MTPRHLRTRRRRRGFFFCCCGPSITVPCTPCNIPKTDLAYALQLHDNISGTTGPFSTAQTLTYTAGGGPGGIDVWRQGTPSGFAGDFPACRVLSLACMDDGSGNNRVSWVVDAINSVFNGVTGTNDCTSGCAASIDNRDYGGFGLATGLQLCSQTASATYSWTESFHDCAGWDMRWQLTHPTRFGGTSKTMLLRVYTP